MVVRPAGYIVRRFGRKVLFEANRSMRLSGALLAAVCLAIACSSRPADATPGGALSGFLQAIERGANDSEALREAYRLLDRRARKALWERARQAETLAGGRRFKPWQMLAPGRFRLRFRPAPGDAMEERIQGDRAVVVVRGDSSQKRAEVQMVREGESWRVVLDIPEMRSASAPGAEEKR